ncbi:cadherin-related family member 5 [Petaurus breviceps papuanus]|uniref:cadherin-related family member 5 n=1 Tax=Petaurus breviceps papuanus TaxID=3040969 RepID=UPI0036DE4D30
MGVSGWALGLLPLLLLLLGAEGQIEVCSVNQELFSVKENELPTKPIANVTAPPGQTVVVSDSNPKDIFDIVNDQLRLIRAPDYETHSVLTAILECKEGSIVVTRLPVIVEVLNVNDMAPMFPFSSKAWNVSENTEVGSTVIPATELTATDADGDTLFYNLSGQSPPGADLVFSLAGVNFPALQLAQALDYDKSPVMVFSLLARDTLESEVRPSHTATATVIIRVVPSDMRPPWFLPCLFTDGRVCIHAQYRGSVPTGSVLTSPLIFEPGPVYAIDGDTAINEPIGYSIIGGNTDDTFQIGMDSGNITMAKAVPDPKTFNLLVQAQQQEHTRSYSVTQVTIEAVAGQLYPPRFPQALYRGWVPPGTGINVVVRDAEDPNRELRLRAEDDDFPAGVPNSHLRYRITNSSAFRMSGEVVLTNDIVGPPQVFYLEAEVLDELTSEKDTTTIEILVQDTKPTLPGGTTPVPLLPWATSSPAPPSPGSSPESTTQGSGTQTSPTSRSTLTQDSPKPSSPGTTLVPTHSGGFPGGQEQQRSMVNEMAILGGVLGALLFLTLVLLGVFIYKNNGCQKCGLSSKHGADFTDSGYDNKTFQAQEPSNLAASASPSPEIGPASQSLEGDPTGRPSNGPAPPPEVETPRPAVREAKEEEKGEAQEEERCSISKEGPVRSILTKERKSEEGGYKGVWFGGDIGAQEEVVVINSPVPEEPEEPEEHVVEPELVLVVHEEPEELLMASVEPQLLLVVPKEPMEPMVVPKEEPDEPMVVPEVPLVVLKEEPEEPMTVPEEEPEESMMATKEEPEEPMVVPKEEPEEPMVVPKEDTFDAKEEPEEPMVVPKEEPEEPMVVPKEEPEESMVVPKEEPEEPMVVPKEEPEDDQGGEMEAKPTVAENEPAPEANNPP